WPADGVRATASFGASFGCGLAMRGFFVGSVISGVFGAGGVSTLLTGSAGGGACTVRPPSVVRPPLRGPGAPPRLIVMTVRGPSSLLARQLSGIKFMNAKD